VIKIEHHQRFGDLVETLVLDVNFDRVTLRVKNSKICVIFMPVINITWKTRKTKRYSL